MKKGSISKRAVVDASSLEEVVEEEEEIKLPISNLNASLTNIRIESDSDELGESGDDTLDELLPVPERPMQNRDFSLIFQLVSLFVC